MEITAALRLVECNSRKRDGKLNQDWLDAMEVIKDYVGETLTIKKLLRETSAELEQKDQESSEHYEQGERYYQDAVLFMQSAVDLDLLYRAKLRWPDDDPRFDKAIAAIQKKCQISTDDRISARHLEDVIVDWINWSEGNKRKYHICPREELTRCGKVASCGEPGHGFIRREADQNQKGDDRAET